MIRIFQEIKSQLFACKVALNIFCGLSVSAIVSKNLSKVKSSRLKSTSLIVDKLKPQNHKNDYFSLQENVAKVALNVGNYIAK
jgi:hypothetical protein